ncbi:MAG: hypothetical protein A3H42_06190 [Deltaproteobacteria bacterium RIFCSPLOWO2_02_FULL_46_8]|nr:MAG: hypothetical protein A3H42_06190 [Deltaproteobacteria bacterium RIFCSPLOWO2_02_FULL_46_8]
MSALHKDRLPIQKVYLFGSYARGNPHRWSDIDLCVVSPRFTDPWKATQYLWSKRTTDRGRTIEPVGFSPKDFQHESPLTREIKKTGIEVA